MSSEVGVDGEFDQMMGMEKKASNECYAKKFRKLPEWVEQAAKRGIRVWITEEGFEIDGFYKQVTLRVIVDEKGHTYSLDKKNSKQEIKTIDDLVRINCDFWKQSREKRVQWQNPGKEWLDDFMRLNLVKRQVNFIPE